MAMAISYRIPRLRFRCEELPTMNDESAEAQILGGVLAGGLPGSAYNAQSYALECRRLFPRAWCAVGVGSQIPRPGDALPVDFAGWPLLLVRNAKGAINAYLNICRHRGMRLVDRACSIDKAIRCPWHSWTYDLDGNLIATPNFLGWRDGGATHAWYEEFGLKRIRTDTWRDLIFVNLDGDGPDLQAHLQELDVFVEPYDFAAFRYAHTWETAFDGNWKLVMEGGIEEYHTPWGHPQYVTGVERYEVEYSLGASSHAGYLVTRVQEDRGLHVPAEAIPLPSVAMGDGERVEYYIINLFPHVLLALEDDHMEVILSRVVFYHYFVGDAAVDAEHRDTREAIYRSQALVFGQDRAFVEKVHANIPVAEAAGLQFALSAHWERAVLHFQTLVRSALD